MADRLLIRPSEEWLEEVRAYRQEFLDENGSMDGAGPLRRCEDPADWLAETRLYERPETVPEGKVPATQFLCVRPSDGRLLGMIQVRHTLNDYLAHYAGHIGYSVRPSERRQGTAAWMLRETLPYCRALGLDRVMVSCLSTNEASRRTILANGGVYDKTVHEPDAGVDLELYRIAL